MKRVLILGASARAAAQSAVKAGWEVTAADLFADRDLQSSADCVAVTHYPLDLAAVRAEHAELPVMYTGAMENYPALLDTFQRCGVLLGNNRATVQRLRDPFRLQGVLARHGIAFPLTQKSFPAKNHDRWLRKFERSAGGFQTQRCQPEWTAGRGYYYQEFIDGPVCSASFVAANGRAVLLGVTDMLVGCAWSGARDFIYSGSIYREADSAESDQWVTIGNVVAKAGRCEGLFGIDAVIRDGQIVPIEVNPRYTSSMETIERRQKESVVGMHIEACLTGTLPQQGSELKAPQTVGKVVLYAQAEIRFPAQVPTVDRGALLSDVPQPESLIAAGKPLVTLIVQGDSESRVLGALRSGGAAGLRSAEITESGSLAVAEPPAAHL